MSRKRRHDEADGDSKDSRTPVMRVSALLNQSVLQRLGNPAATADELMYIVRDAFSSDRDAFIDALALSIIGVPSMSYVHAIILSYHHESPAVVSAVLDRVTRKTADVAASGTSHDLLCCAIGLASLARVGFISGDALIAFLRGMLSSAGASSSPIPRRLVFPVVCACTVYAGESLSKTAASSLAELVVAIAAFAEEHASALRVPSLSIRLRGASSAADGHVSENAAAVEAVNAIHAAAKNGWRLSFLSHSEPLAPVAAVSDVTLPTTLGAAALEAMIHERRPSTHLSFVGRRDGPQLYEQWVMRTLTGATLDCFGADVGACSRLTIIPPMIVEELFDRITATDADAKPNLGVNATLLALVCLQSRSLLGHVGDVSGRIFRAAAAFDPVALSRAAWALAYHITMHDFQWPWETWDSVIDGRSDASQRLFVHVAVSALSDLTTPDRFVRVVPPPFAHLLPPPRPAAFPLPPGAVIGPELTNLEAAIRSRAPFSEISPLLSAVRSLLGASSEAPVFAAALLVATQDSPRHVLDWTDHYDAHFRTLIGASPDASRAAAAAAIAAGAQKSSLMRVVLPKWVERGYVSPSAAVEALLDHVAEGKVPWFERFSCVDVEAVVADCVRPVVSRMEKCGKGEEYEKAKREFVQVCCKTVSGLLNAVEGDAQSLGVESGLYVALARFTALKTAFDMPESRDAVRAILTERGQNGILADMDANTH